MSAGRVPGPRPSASQVLGQGVVIWAVYLVARTLLLRAIPSVSWATYNLQEDALTAARLTCAGLTWAVARRRWSLALLGWHGQHAALVAGVGMVLIAGDVVLGWRTPFQSSMTVNIRIQEVLHATAPALNEEISFRGLMYTAIAELAGPGAAVTISTGLFTAIHFGYQRSWNAYPGMVLVGLAFAVLRRRGASLGWLILMHFAIDATWFGYGFRLGYGGPAYLYASWVIKTLGVLIAWRWPLMRRS